MQRFTFASSTAKSIVSDITRTLIESTYDMSNDTAGHFRQICEDLNGWPIAVELPKTWSDVPGSTDVFEDTQGKCKEALASWYHPEHTTPYLKGRGCTVIQGVVRYMSDSGYYMQDDADIAMMTAAQERVLQVHMALVHNTPTDAQERQTASGVSLAQWHDELLEEFYDACASRPPRLHPVTN